MKLSQLTLYSGRLLFSSLHTGGTRCVASVRRQSRFAKDKMASAKSSILPISYLRYFILHSTLVNALPALKEF